MKLTRLTNVIATIMMKMIVFVYTVITQRSNLGDNLTLRVIS